MRRHRAWDAWVAVALLLALAGCGRSTPSLPRLADGDVVLAFGDSLTYGTGAQEAESYPAVLESLIGRHVVREGVPGEVSAEGLERLPAALEQHRPRLLLLCMGGNDMLRGVDAATTTANLRSMIDLAKARGIGVVLIAVPQPRLFAGNAPFYGELARSTGVVLEEKALGRILYDNAAKSDEIHPNARGYRMLAEAIAEVLKKNGAVK